MIEFIKNNETLRTNFKFQFNYIIEDYDGDVDAYFLDIERHGFYTQFEGLDLKEMLNIVIDIHNEVEVKIPCEFNFNDSEWNSLRELSRFIMLNSKEYFSNMIFESKMDYILFAIKNEIFKESMNDTSKEALIEISETFYGFNHLSLYNRHMNELSDEDKEKYNFVLYTLE